MERDRRAYSDDEIDAAVEQLTEPGRLEMAQRIVEHSAPQLQTVLAEALQEGDWFGSAHQAAVRQAALVDDPDERLTAIKILIAEETRLSMLVGVAVGIELGTLLNEADPPPEKEG